MKEKYAMSISKVNVHFEQNFKMDCAEAKALILNTEALTHRHLFIPIN